MKKYFVCSDIHSFYDEWMSALQEKEFDINNSDHMVVVLGDLFDRGPKPKECLQFINSLPDNRKILIRGNHEDLMLEAIARKQFFTHDYHNCTPETAIKVSGLDPNLNSDAQILGAFRDNEDWQKYISSCVDYAEVGNNLFVHGWVPCQGLYYGTGKLLDPYVLPRDEWTDTAWKDARWFNGMSMWNQGARIPGMTIWCGHWHSQYGHQMIHHSTKDTPWDLEDAYCLLEPQQYLDRMYECTKSFIDEGIVCLDSCVVCSGRINCEVIEIE